MHHDDIIAEIEADYRNARVSGDAVDRNSPAFLAAYHALTCRVGRDELCQLMAGLTTARLVALRNRHGMGLMLTLTQSLGAAQELAAKIWTVLPAEWDGEVSVFAVVDAVQAAARVLEKGQGW